MPSPEPSWTPPHCPNPDCDFHVDPQGWRFKRAGFFTRVQPPHKIQRYVCSHCGRFFSSQTFSITYWLKRADLLVSLVHGEVGGSAHRQLARQHGVAHSTVQRHIERAGRHALLFHETLREKARALVQSEPALILDGLVSFAGGQYWPVEVTNLIGAESGYSHDFALTERRRSGSMTPHQKKRRAAYEARLGRPDPRGLEKDVRALLEACLPADSPIVLRSDEKTEYARVLGRLSEHRIVHETTHSKAPRIPQNPLQPVNRHHMFMRHSGANHKRETVAFSKRIQAVVWRQAIFQAWKNCVKWGSENEPGRTPAQKLGVLKRRLSVEETFSARIFPTRMALGRRLADRYWGRIRSRFLDRERGHGLAYAF